VDLRRRGRCRLGRRPHWPHSVRDGAPRGGRRRVAREYLDRPDDSIATVCASAADLLAYAVGARWGTTLRDKFLRSDRVWSSEKSERKVRGVRAQLDERPWIITVARFIPALRTVTMYSAGTLEFPRRRFLLHEVPGALLWASFHVLIGYLLGRVFEDTSFWVPFAVSTGIAGALAVVFEVVTHQAKARGPGDDGR